MKSERITVLGTPEFKAFLAAEAAKENVSMSELVRRRCERAPSDEDALLANMAAELRRAVAQAKSSLEDSLKAAHAALGEAQANRQEKTA